MEQPVQSYNLKEIFDFDYEDEDNYDDSDEDDLFDIYGNATQYFDETIRKVEEKIERRKQKESEDEYYDWL